MLPLLLLSTCLRAAASLWTVALTVQYRDWRIAAFTAAVSLSVVRGGFQLAQAWDQPGAWELASADLDTALDAVIGVLCLVAAAAGRGVLRLERRHREQLVLESEARARRFAESRDDGVWALDLNGRTSYVNRALGEFLGRTPADLLGRDWLELVPADRHAEAHQILAELPLRQGTLDNVTLRRPDGTLLWARLHLALLHAEDGNREGYLATVADVTSERVAALGRRARQRLLEELAVGASLEAILRELTQGLEAAFPGNRYAFRLLDPEGGVLEALGPYAPGPARLAVPPEVLDPDGPQPPQSPAAAAHPAQAAALLRQRVALGPAQDQPLWADLRAELAAEGLGSGWALPLLGSGGRLVGTLETYVPEARSPREEELALGETAAQLAALAADRRRTEEAFRRTQALLEAALQESQAGILVVDAATRRIRLSNAASHAMLGHREGDQVGMPLKDHFARLRPRLPDGRELRPEESPLERALTQGVASKDLDLLLVGPDGTESWYLVNAAPIRGADGTIEAALALFLDVTARRQAEDAREGLLQRLRAQNEELEEVFRATSHDLRSPLVNIQGFATEVELAVRELGRQFEDAALEPERAQRVRSLLAQDIAGSLEYVRSGATKMGRLLDGLSAVSRYGGRELTLIPVDMNELASHEVRELGYQIQARGAEVRTDNLPPCLGDRNELSQVLSNLLDNALKYLDPSRPGRIRISGRTREREVEYRISDNGIGIDPRHQAKVFETFRRLDPEGPVPGEGLGLSILTRIVERHGGQVGLESAPGVGSTFWVRLAAVPARELREVNLEPARGAAGPRGAGVKQTEAAPAAQQERPPSSTGR